MLVAEPFSEAWTLTVEGIEVPADPSFGWAMSFTSPTEGSAVLEYRRPFFATAMVVFQIVLWLLLLRVAAAEQGVVRRWRGAVPDQQVPQ